MKLNKYKTNEVTMKKILLIALFFTAIGFGQQVYISGISTAAATAIGAGIKPASGMANKNGQDSLKAIAASSKVDLDSSLVHNITRVDTAKSDTCSYTTLHSVTIPTVIHFYVYTIWSDSALYVSNKWGAFTSTSFYIPAGGSFTSAQKDATAFPILYYQKKSGYAGVANVVLKIEGR